MRGIQKQTRKQRIAEFRGIVGTNAKVTSGRLVTSKLISLHLKASKLLLEERNYFS